MANGEEEGISMTNLKHFLQSNGFEVCNEEIYAIIRRCDHDGDTLLSFHEF